jgi:NAD(P)H-hydrate epimerase
LRRRNPDTHKGDYGHVFILGGSPGLSGAVCLSSQAALRAGAGLVTAGVPKSLNQIFEIKLTEAMSLPLPDKDGYLVKEAFGELRKVLDKIDVIVIGPGASRNRGTQQLLLKVAREIDKPMVADADAINALSLKPGVLDNRNTKNLILTPHAGEFSRLISLEKAKVSRNRKHIAKQFAFRYNLTLVLKGHRTLVSNGKKIFENNTGNPGMATAGMGDVLAGIISALIAQGLDCFEASKTGVYLHGLAGDLAAKDKTQQCLVASDVIDYLPQALKVLLKKCR